MNSGSVDFHAEKYVRLLTQIPAVVKYRLSLHLIRGEVEISVGGQRQRIRPEHARIMHQGFDLSPRVSPANGVVFVIAQIHAPFGVGFKPIPCAAFLAEILDGSGDCSVGQSAIRQPIYAYAIEMPTGQGTIVERLAVWADGNSIGTNRESLRRLAGEAQGEDLAFGHRNKF